LHDVFMLPITQAVLVSGHPRKMSTIHGADDLDPIGAPEEVRQSATQLLPLMYDDLRRLARNERRRVHAGQTLQTTALIHEAYLKLHRSERFNDRSHFLRAAALAMRHILINHARDRIAAKRGGSAMKLPLELASDVATPSDETLLELNEALQRLSKLSPRLAQVVECRYFAGYDDAETAVALQLTDRTVRRDWVKARAWLRRELRHERDFPA
jgi:RNA polymerase sigma factor (TIGR02999 family)